MSTAPSQAEVAIEARRRIVAAKSNETRRMALDCLRAKMPHMSGNALLRVMATLWHCRQLDLIATFGRSKQLVRKVPTLHDLERMSEFSSRMLLQLIVTQARYGPRDMIAARAVSESELIQRRLQALDRLIKKLPDMTVNMLLLAIKTLSVCNQLDLMTMISWASEKSKNQALALDWPLPDTSLKMLLRAIETLQMDGWSRQVEMFEEAYRSEIAVSDTHGLATEFSAKKIKDSRPDLLLRLFVMLSKQSQMSIQNVLKSSNRR